MWMQQTRQGGARGVVDRLGAAAGTQPRGSGEGDRWQRGRFAYARAERLARGLGWYSLGLGIPQTFAPRGFARFIGLDDRGTTPAIVRLVGLREIACGIGILTQRRPAAWLWMRVLGDIMDLTLLSAALTSDNARRPGRVAAATASVVGVMVLDFYSAQQLSRSAESMAGGQQGPGIRVRWAITLNRPIEEVYQFWRDPQNLPRFMSRVESVQMMGERRSHWRVRGPMGRTIEFDSEIVEDRPNEMIAWRTLEGAPMSQSGTVWFRPAPGGRGTEVEVEMQYAPRAKGIGVPVVRLLAKPLEQQLRQDLRTFKELMETGEIVRSEATIWGRRVPQRPAQPPASMQSR
jgi:uncharacterized membrane protein